MAQTRTPYLIIDDSEIDAESPITESLMTRLRDQWYAALADPATAAPASDRVAAPERLKDTRGTPTAGDPLVSDGSGGFEFGPSLGSIGNITSNTGDPVDFLDVTITDGANDVYRIDAQSVKVSTNTTYHGFAQVIGGVIQFQSSTVIDQNSAGGPHSSPVITGALFTSPTTTTVRFTTSGDANIRIMATRMR